jgi:hypothetical protein
MGKTRTQIVLSIGNDETLWQYACLQEALQDALPSLASMISNTTEPTTTSTDDTNNSRDKAICAARAGGETLAVIGARYGLSPQRISQILQSYRAGK